MVSDSLPSRPLSEASPVHRPDSALSIRWSSLRHLPKWFLASLLGLALLLVGGPLMLKQRSTTTASKVETAPVKRALPVETLVVEPVSSYSVSRSFTGEIAALRSSSVGFERSGTLTAMLVSEGNFVTKGQPLASTDIQNLKTQRLQLVAQQSQAEAQLSELQAGARIEDINAARAAVRDLEEQLRLQNVQRARRTALYKEGAISREQLDEFTYGAASLQARIDQANSNLQELLNGNRPQEIAGQQAVVQQLQATVADLDVTISKSTITAPFSGVVAEKLVDEGTVVGAGQSVLRISESAAPEARIGVPAEMISQLTIGESLQAKSATNQFLARVVSILPEVDATTRTQTVVLALDPELLTRVTPGQTVQVNLTETIASEGYWLPTSALTQGIRGLWNCFVLVPDSQEEADDLIIAQQAIEILHQEGDRVLVRGTLQPGDQVVANGVHRMAPGQLVKPIGTSTDLVSSSRKTTQKPAQN